MRRRTFVGTLGVGAVTAIAGCGGTDDTGPSPTPPEESDTPSGDTPSGDTPSGESDTPEGQTTDTPTEGTGDEQASYDSYPFSILTDNQEDLMTGLPHFDGFDDRRGDGTVTVEQGRTGEGETYSFFYPPAVWLDVGQTVDFTVGDDESGDYNVQHRQVRVWGPR